MAVDLEKVIFKDKKFSDILGEIYDNHKKKDKQINALINELKPLINEIGDATLVVPLIKDYMDSGIKNDDLLVKLAVIIQKAQEKSADPKSGDNEFGISDAEKEQLLKDLDKLTK